MWPSTCVPPGRIRSYVSELCVVRMANKVLSSMATDMCGVHVWSRGVLPAAVGVWEISAINRVQLG